MVSKFQPRFRLRFGVRTLLLLMAGLAVWLGVHLQRTKSQKQAVEAIRAYGGWVQYDFQYPTGVYGSKDFDGKALPRIPAALIRLLGIDFFQSVVQVSLVYSNDTGQRLENDNRSDEALQHLPAFPKLRILLLQGGQASDDNLKHVGQLRKLEHLYMWDVSSVSDAGVEHLANLKQLKSIHISNSRITDGSLSVFASCKQLECLSLQFNDFTDNGVRKLLNLPRLTDLWVCGTAGRKNAITDQILLELEKKTSLVGLGVQNTEVTAEGVARFKLSVPGCKVHH